MISSTLLLAATAALLTQTSGSAEGRAGSDPVATTVRVEVSGVRGEVRRNVLSRLAIANLEASPDLYEARVRSLHDEAPGQIRNALEPFGHYRPDIRANLERIGADDWLARYRISPGEVLTFTSVTLDVEGEGRGDPSFEAVLRNRSIRPGSPFRHAAWEDAKRTLENRAAALGYLDAALTESRVVVDRGAYRARAVLRLRTGPRYRFGSVEFQGTDLDRRVLQRHVPFDPGDPFSLEQLMALQVGLSGTGYFGAVRVEPLRDQAESDLRVPVVARLEHRNRDGYDLSLGYGTDTGPRASAGWNRRWFDERGHQAEARLEASMIRIRASSDYRIPIGRSAADLFTVGAGGVAEQFEDISSRSLVGRASVTHLRGSWRETFSFSIQEEWSRIGDAESRSTLLLPGASWSYVSLGGFANEAAGLQVLLSMRGTSEAVGSDLSFLQASTTMRGTLPISGQARVHARTEVAGTVVSDLDQLPASFRYFAGGDGSVRGYGFRSLAPQRADGLVIGGRHLLTGSLEYEHDIFGPVGIAVFVDAGNAMERLARVTLRTGAGAGVRWRSPVGPVRLDVAWALDRPGVPARLHFSVGSGL